MRIIKLLVNEKLSEAEADMRKSTPENLVESTQRYLRLLDEYRDRLRRMQRVPRVADAAHSPFALELVTQTRGAVKDAIENTTNERNRVDTLLESFTLVTGWAAVETFNLHDYRNACDWELIGTEVRAVSQGVRLSVPEAVLAARRLRREAYFDTRLAKAA